MKITGPFEIGDFKPGTRVEISPATDMWMRGARFGTVIKTVRNKAVRIKLDLVERPTLAWPEDIYAIIE